jgi:hypothetical protein
MRNSGLSAVGSVALAVAVAAVGAGCEGRSLAGAGIEPLVVAAHTGRTGDPASGMGATVILGSEVPGAVGGYVPLEFRMSWLETEDDTTTNLASLVVWQKPEQRSPTSYLTWEFGFIVYDSHESTTAYGVMGGLKWCPYFKRFGYAGRGSFAVALRASGWAGTDMHDIVFGAEASAGVWLAWGEVPGVVH